MIMGLKVNIDTFRCYLSVYLSSNTFLLSHFLQIIEGKCEAQFNPVCFTFEYLFSFSLEFLYLAENFSIYHVKIHLVLLTWCWEDVHLIVFLL